MIKRKDSRLESFIAMVLLSAISVATVLGQNRGYDPASMDKNTSACADFYQFANGGWLKNMEIPPAYSSWGSFNVLNEYNRKVLREILEEAAKKTNATRGSADQKIGDFYASCVDEAKREAEGMKPLVPELARIDRIKNLQEVQARSLPHRHNVPTLLATARCRT